MGRTDRNHALAERRRSGQEFQALSHRILSYANRGILRIYFQMEVSKMILDFSGCDTVELWLKDHGKYFRCKAVRTLRRSASSDITFSSLPPSLPGLPREGSVWTISSGKLRPQHPKASGKTLPQSLGIGRDYQSLGLIPLQIERQDIGLLLLGSKGRNFFKKSEIARYEGLAQSLGIASAHRRAQVDLRERVKELTCLYGIARLVARPGISLAEILQGITLLLPPAWLYPELASARIILDGHSHTTPDFKEGTARQTSEITVNGISRGFVEVGYGQEKPELDEGPFLNEERTLLDAVAKEIATIVQRREAEEVQVKLQEQLRHADRLATIGQLAAGVAHELNEPLSNILGFTQLIKKCPGLPQQAEQDLDKILTASLHARDIIREILIFARQMPPQKRRVALNQVIKEGLSFFESRCAKEGIEISCLFFPDLPDVLADPAQLNQVLVNLVINALQAMPKGGKLTLQTLRDQDSVTLLVEDTGMGMSEEVRRQVFTPFFTTKDVGQGTGLGLPVVHGIITSHGGTIDVESQIGQGTRFVIKLPVIKTSDRDGGSQG